MSDLVPSGRRGVKATVSEELRQYVSIMIADQLFGIPVLIVHDVLGPQRITRIPLAPPEVAGSLNLRGRIVTAIDVRLCLGLDARPADMPGMSVVVELGTDLYSLIVDNVGEVLTLLARSIEPNPPTLDARWRGISSGICRLEDRLLVMLDADRLLDFGRTEAA